MTVRTSVTSILIIGASLVAQRAKRLSATWETWFQSPSREDPLEKEAKSTSTPTRGNPQVLLPGKLLLFVDF